MALLPIAAHSRASAVQIAERTKLKRDDPDEPSIELYPEKALRALVETTPLYEQLAIKMWRRRVASEPTTDRLSSGAHIYACACDAPAP